MTASNCDGTDDGKNMLKSILHHQSNWLVYMVCASLGLLWHVPGRFAGHLHCPCQHDCSLISHFVCVNCNVWTFTLDQIGLGTEAVLLVAAGYIESSAYDGKLTMLDMYLGGGMNRQTRVNTSSQMFVDNEMKWSRPFVERWERRTNNYRTTCLHQYGLGIFWARQRVHMKNFKSCIRLAFEQLLRFEGEGAKRAPGDLNFGHLVLECFWLVPGSHVWFHFWLHFCIYRRSISLHCVTAGDMTH